MRPRSIVFDLFGDYLRYRGGETRLRNLVALLETFDVGESTTRVVMARLRKEGWFETRTVGRETVYSLTARSWQMLDKGRSRIFERDTRPWNGQWHMVIYAVPETDRGLREELRRELAWLGFGPLATSTWISPRDRLAEVAERFGDDARVRLDLLTCNSAGLPNDREMASRCWDLAGLNREYAALLKRFRPVFAKYRNGSVEPARALVLRTQLINDYRRFPFRDPDLPVELLPAKWRGGEVHEFVLEAHKLLAGPADEYVDEILAANGAEVSAS